MIMRYKIGDLVVTNAGTRAKIIGIVGDNHYEIKSNNGELVAHGHCLSPLSIKKSTKVDDFKQITNDNSLLTKINTYVHPFNTFKNLKISFSAIGRITLKKEAYYTRKQIEETNQKVDEIYNKLYDTSKTPRENIKIFHDYLINNTKYDKNNTTGSPNIISSNAYGVFTKGLGICNAYTDAMSLFLEKMKIKNYRIASNTHIWNFVYLEGNWYHLDLTFDDIIMYDDSEKLVYDYFLITNNELEQYNDEDHVYDKYTYIEAQ